ncbi:hypothetical protein PLESTB_000439700 [Pleodorina starrii]|uniref:Uncharacterized protein n=1 Tax=Pleodorina starrii TaxID=330485 RepID=A0A9W6BFL8_9CHLO|nr:hypothetical protein PLESTB_000439700 [Pleodorina starrii]GLC73946.1 hypothetical protein PLESTF_001440700 [Pleodorina starrii]
MSAEADLQHERRRRYPLAKVKGGWTGAEDQILKRLVDEFGEGNWSVIARHLNAALGKPAESGRIGKQCRERYNHHLRPDIKKDAWTEEEESLLVSAHLKYGNRWSDIAKVIKGRTENAVKNHWNATLRRKDTDKCGGRGGSGAPQSCVLKDYMIRIALLPGTPAASAPAGAAKAGGCPDAAPPGHPFRPVAADTPAAAALAAAAGLAEAITEPEAPAAAPLLFDCSAGAAAAGAASQLASKRHRTAEGATAVGPSVAVAGAAAAGGGGGGGGVEAVSARTGGRGSSPSSSSCSSQEGLAAAPARRSFEAAAPSLPAAAGTGTSAAAAAAAPPASAAAAAARKRPRIITFAVGPAFTAGAASAAAAPQLRGGGPALWHNDGVAAPAVVGGSAAGAALKQRERLAPPPPQAPAADTQHSAGLVPSPAAAAALHLPGPGRTRPVRLRGERQPGWSTDSAEESVQGSPMSERFERFEEGEEEEGEGLRGGEGGGGGGGAACSELQAAQIMLALKSLAGSL